MCVLVICEIMIAKSVDMSMLYVFCCWQEAVKCGIHRTVHAGEVGPPSVVEEVRFL